MISIREYVKAESLEQAYELNQKANNVIIGGMHWLKMSKQSFGTAIDMSGLGLDQIVETDDSFEIGCMATLRNIELHEGLNVFARGAIRDAVKDIVGVQFRNTATVGGSIYGRYGFSDVLAVFMAMDTKVVCYKAGELSICDYAELKPDRDIVVKLIVRKTPTKVAYQAVRRQKTDFPVLAVCVSEIDGKWSAVISARPGRAVKVADEKGILADGITEESAKAFGEYAAEQVGYSSNIRGSAEYRKTIAPVLIRRALMSLGKEA